MEGACLRGMRVLLMPTNNWAAGGGMQQCVLRRLRCQVLVLPPLLRRRRQQQSCADAVDPGPCPSPLLLSSPGHHRYVNWTGGSKQEDFYKQAQPRQLYKRYLQQARRRSLVAGLLGTRSLLLTWDLGPGPCS